MSDYPTWAQRKSWNNDGMDPDWKPSDSSTNPTYTSNCKECAHRLYNEITKAWPDMKFNFSSNTLPEFSDMKQVSIPIDRLKEFNASQKELIEFSALVCGVDSKKLSRLDMQNYLIKILSEKE